MFPLDSGSAAARPRILFVDHVRDVLGGAEINLIELLDWKRSRTDWEAAVACAPGGRLHDVLDAKGVRCLDYALPVELDRLRVVGRRFRALEAVKGWLAMRHGATRLAGVLRSFSPDLVISVTNKDHLVSGGVCGRHRVGSVWWVNDLMTRDFFSWPVRSAFFHRAKRGSDWIMTVSECCRRALLSGGVDPRRVEVVPNGLDLERYAFRGGSEGAGLANATGAVRWNVGWIGRITPWKGPELFLDIAARWKELGLPGQFCIVGEASKADSGFEVRLRARIRQEGLAESVRIVPYQADVREALSGLDALVHCSIRPEPFGRVVLEAQALGVPVVATNQGGIPELVQHGVTGLLAEPGNLESFVAALRELHSMRETVWEMRRRARSLVESRFGIERVFGAVDQRVRLICGHS